MSDELTIAELEDIVAQGKDAHVALARRVSEDIAHLSELSYKVGRYQQLLTMAKANEGSDEETVH